MNSRTHLEESVDFYVVALRIIILHKELDVHFHHKKIVSSQHSRYYVRQLNTLVGFNKKKTCMAFFCRV